MTPARTLVVVLLVTLLAVDLAAANAAVAADRTVMNPDFVTSTLEDEDAYEAMEPLVLESLPVDEFETGEDAPPLPVDAEAVVSAAVDPAYLRSQVEPNVERTYAYLHGRSETLELTVDVEPAKTAIVDAVEAELVDASATELVETVAADGEEGLSIDAGGVTVDLRTVGRMAENESVFESERATLRADVRDRIVDGLVEKAFDQSSDDALLTLVIDGYDPDAYTEAEKDRLVADNEDDIRDALRAEIEAEDDGEIAAAVDDRLAEVRDTVRANVTATLDDGLGEVDPAVAEPATALVLVGVDGYLGDVSHATFSREFEAAADDLAVAVAGLLEAELDEQVPDRVDLTDELDPGARTALEDARQAVQLVDLLSLGLPAIGLVLVGAIHLVSGSIVVTAVGAGLGLAAGGLPTLVAATQLRSVLEGALAGAGLPSGVGPLVLALAGRLADAVFAQSAAVVALGVVLVVAGLVLHFGIVDWPRDDDAA